MCNLCTRKGFETKTSDQVDDAKNASTYHLRKLKIWKGLISSMWDLVSIATIGSIKKLQFAQGQISNLEVPK